MKFYVAGKYCEKDIIRQVHTVLRKSGHDITLNWTDHDIYPEDSPAEKMSQFAKDDIEGVLSADAFVGILLNDHPYKGLWVEMGTALGKGMPCYLVGSAGDDCIFSNHYLVRKFNSLEDLYDYIKKIS